MAKAKRVVRRAWTKDDVRTMKTMAKAKSGVAKIAKALKRTPGATTVMAAKLGYPFQRVPKWNSDRPPYGLSPLSTHFQRDDYLRHAARGLTTT